MSSLNQGQILKDLTIKIFKELSAGKSNIQLTFLIKAI